MKALLSTVKSLYGPCKSFKIIGDDIISQDSLAILSYIDTSSYLYSMLHEVAQSQARYYGTCYTFTICFIAFLVEEFHQGILKRYAISFQELQQYFHEVQVASLFELLPHLSCSRVRVAPLFEFLSCSNLSLVQVSN